MKLTLILWIFLMSRAIALPEIFATPLHFDNLNHSVLNASFLGNAPLPRVKVLRYKSFDMADNQPYSDYQIMRLNTKHHLSRYQTVEVPVGRFSQLKTVRPLVEGQGIGYGGIISLAYEKAQTRYAKREKWGKFYKKYAITRISHIQGQLFPLRVGNVLKFNYRDSTDDSNNSDFAVSHSGMIEYRVVKKLKNYNRSRSPVTGDIYVIQFLKNTRGNLRMKIQNEYYFSTKLGWYIVAKYYNQQRLVALYRLVDWR